MTNSEVSDASHGEDARMVALGYKEELKRVLSFFDNFSVAFSYLSPMVGIYSLYTLGLGTGGPRYIWTIPMVVAFMTLVALVFGELASEYPLSGALYQYGKYNVGPRYGWYVGWIYGFALLATVATPATPSASLTACPDGCAAAALRRRHFTPRHVLSTPSAARAPRCAPRRSCGVLGDRAARARSVQQRAYPASLRTRPANRQRPPPWQRRVAACTG